MVVLAQILISAAAAAAAAQAGGAAGDAKAAPATESNASQLTESEAKKAASACGARRFQTVAEAIVNGESRRATIMLCAKPTDSNEQWAATLEKSAAQIAASPTISAESKARLRAQFELAIAEARSGKAPATGGSQLTGVTPLPGLPPPPKRSLVKPIAPADALVSNVPSLPPPPPPVAATASTAAALSLIGAPSVDLTCLESGESGPGLPCEEVRASMTLLLKARENFARPATLRFVRRGEARAELDLGAMRRGQVRRLRIPAEVCRGLVRSELRLELVPAPGPNGNPTHATTAKGPYDLRC